MAGEYGAEAEAEGEAEGEAEAEEAAGEASSLLWGLMVKARKALQCKERIKAAQVVHGDTFRSP